MGLPHLRWAWAGFISCLREDLEQVTWAQIIGRETALPWIESCPLEGAGQVGAVPLSWSFLLLYGLCPFLLLDGPHTCFWVAVSTA